MPPPGETPVQQEPRDRRPDQEARYGGDPELPHLLQGERLDEGARLVEQPDAQQQGGEPQPRVQRVPHAGGRREPPGLLVHPLHPPGEGDPGEEQQESAEDADGAAAGVREQLLHGVRGVAGEPEPTDERRRDDVAGGPPAPARPPAARAG